MPPMLTDPTQEARLRANQENLVGLFASFVGWPGIRVARDSVCLRTISDHAFPLFNSVLGARLSEANLEATVAGILAPYVDRGLPMMWWDGPVEPVAKLGPALAANGLVHVASAPCLSARLDDLDLEPEPIAGVRIELVWNRDLARDWSRALRVAFGFPRFATDAYTEAMTHAGFGPDAPFEHWVAYCDGTPVASSTLFRCAGVAGIYNVATLPRVRGLGIGEAVMRAPMREARREGFRVAVLQGAAQALPVYRRLGFQQDGTVAQYVLAGRGA